MSREIVINDLLTHLQTVNIKILIVTLIIILPMKYFEGTMWTEPEFTGRTQ